MWQWPDSTGAPTPDLYDEFVDADGTTLPAHTPNIGGPWVNVGTDITITGNKALVTNASGINNVAFPHENFDLQFTFQADAVASQSLEAGVIQGASFSQAGIEVTLGLSGYVELYAQDVTGNQYVDIAGAWTADTAAHVLRLVATSDSLLLFFDGSLIGSATRPSWLTGLDTFFLEMVAGVGNNIAVEPLSLTAL